MPSFIHLNRVDRARDQDEPEPEDLDGADRAWLNAWVDRQALRFKLASCEPPTRFEQRCVTCGPEGRPIAVYGHPPVVLIAGSATPPPPTIVFCDRCVEEYQLGPGVPLAEDLINAWRTAKGLPERDFSRL
jgi:hypothetical protein